MFSLKAEEGVSTTISQQLSITCVNQYCFRAFILHQRPLHRRLLVRAPVVGKGQLRGEAQSSMSIVAVSIGSKGENTRMTPQGTFSVHQGPRMILLQKG